MKGISQYSKRKVPFIMILIFILVAALIAASLLGYWIWDMAFRSNVMTGHGDPVELHIPSGSRLNDVLDILDEKNLILRRSSLEWLAKRKNYHNNIYPGRYGLTDGMSNNELINLLRSGNQVPVNLVFISQRRIEDLASVVSRQIEADSADIANLSRNTEFIDSLGFEEAGLPAMFVPNTYQVYWNTSARQFYIRMKREYERFWNEERESKRSSLGLSRVQVSTLASIVDEETVKAEEMPVIAGVYLNRLSRGMRLQADPTIKYAIGDFTVNRILRVHLETDSPYNTYRYSGLPPGPIVIPSVQAIDAVLGAGDHDYLYFCAREDFSGFHRFARTLAEHNRNARLYQNALNQRRVFR